MKSFKEFLENYDPYLDPVNKKRAKEDRKKMEQSPDFVGPPSPEEEPTPEELNWGKMATGIQVGREFFDGTNLTADNALLVGGLYSTPTDPMSRFNAEKVWGTDMGLAYDVEPGSREVYANPEGFKAVAKREKEGRSFPTWFPQKTLDQTNKDFWDNFRVWNPERRSSR